MDLLVKLFRVITFAMEPCPIKNLPSELLCRTFDLLSPKDQLSAMATCRQWSEILSATRYLRNHVLMATSYIIAGHDVEDVKHYPLVEIRGIWDIVTFDAVRSYLFNEEVAQNLEELHLVSYNHQLAQLFAGEKTVHLPKLRKLRTVYGFQNELTFIAPNLKCVEMDSGEDCYDGTLALQILDQIEELKVSSMFGRASPVGLSQRSFTNLRRLSVKDGHGKFYVENFCKYASGLTHLNLSIIDPSSPLTPNVLLPLTTNLQVLNLTLHSVEYKCLENLQQLKELSIAELFPQHEALAELKISLPNLRKLKVNFPLAPPLVTKNLSTLHLNLRRGVKFFRKDVDAFFIHIGRNLQVLIIDWMENMESSFFAEQICTMTQLQSLKLSYSGMEQSDLERIFKELKQLRRARFVECNLRLDGKQLDPNETDNIFEGLRTQFLDCSIVAHSSAKRCQYFYF